MKTENLRKDFDELLREIAERHSVDPELVKSLIEFESTKVHLEKRRGAKKHIRKAIQNWLEGDER